MEAFALPIKNSVISVAASSDTDRGVFEEEEEEACSICFEPFTSDDPATVTNCKHEYHLQCILEWSQRSKECPICWQLLVLKDPASQELLAAVEMERNSRSRRGSSNISIFRQISFNDVESDHAGSYTEDSDFDDSVMRHLAASTIGRTHHFRRERHISYVDQGMFLGFVSPSDGSDLEHPYTNTPVGSQNIGNLVSREANSAASVMSSGGSDQPPSAVLSSCPSTGSNITDIRHDPPRPTVSASQTPPYSPRRSRTPDLLSFSESFKSRFSAASARYKESISKSTRGLKEKLLSRNNSVKELSKEVQREVAAGISGVARIMERLDPTSKQTGPSPVPVTSDAVGTSDLPQNRKVMQDNLISQFHNGSDEKIMHATSSNVPSLVSSTLPSTPGHMRVTREQDVL